MKFYIKGLLFITLILLGGLQNAFSQSCSLPAPASAWVNETTPTSIEIEWTPVTGAANYEIITEEVGTGTIISTVIQAGTIYVATGLQPSTDYVFAISPLCNNGGRGNTIEITAPTGVIVVDVIFQLECPSAGPSGAHGPGSSATYPFSGNPVIAFDGKITNHNNVPFKIIVDDQTIIPGSFRSGNTVGTTQNFTNVLSFVNTVSPSFVEVYYDDPNTGSLVHLADITPSTGSRGKVIVDWKEQVDVSATHCAFATWQGDDGGFGDDGGGKGDGQFGLVMAPNPSGNYVNVSTNFDTPVQISDLYGNPWYEGEIQVGEDLNLDLSAWPAGTYILSYFDGYKLQAKQLIKL